MHGIHWLRVVRLLSLQVQVTRGAIGSSLRSCQVGVPDLMEVQDPRAGETSLAELTGIQLGTLSNQDTVSASMVRESWFTYVALISVAAACTDVLVVLIIVDNSYH